jgi:multiple sugar transport system ATP-binding protein
VEQAGTPVDLYERPLNRFVAGFVGSPAINFLDLPLAREGERMQARLGSVALSVPAGIAAQLVGRPQVTLGLRPEHLHLGSQAGDALALTAEVGEIEFTGAQSQVSLRTAAGMLLLSAADRPALQAGDMTTLGLPAHRLHFFDTVTGLRLVDGG